MANDGEKYILNEDEIIMMQLIYEAIRSRYYEIKSQKELKK